MRYTLAAIYTNFRTVAITEEGGKKPGTCEPGSLEDRLPVRIEVLGEKNEQSHLPDIYP